MCLKLGEIEEYIASGPSIKKAQHAAAAIALEKTSLKHPPPKTKTTKNGKFGYESGRHFVFVAIFLNFHRKRIHNLQILLCFQLS